MDVHQKVFHCMRHFQTQTPPFRDMCHFILQSILSLTHGTRGYIGRFVEPSVYCYETVCNLEDHITVGQKFYYETDSSQKSPRPFGPMFKTDQWLNVPLTFYDQPCGIVAVETDNSLKLADLYPLVPTTVSAIMQYYQRIEQFEKHQHLILSSVSHEILTPLNGIIGLNHIMRKYKQYPDLQQHFKVLDICSEQLNTTISDIMDMSKLGYGQFKLQHESFQLPQIIQNALHIAKSRFEKFNPIFSIDYDTFTQQHNNFIGDGHRIQQVLINLVTNAIKFNSPTRPIKLKIRTKPSSIKQPSSKSSTTESSTESIDKRLICIHVRDHGCGIREEFFETIFEPFRQLSSKVSIEGTGLGLSICKKLVTAMNGTISVHKSTPQFGTCIDIKIPLIVDKETKSSIPYQLTPIETPLHVLVVEDNFQNQYVLNEMLVELKINPQHIKTASDGIEALQLSTRYNFDLILMDLHMPTMNGLVATQEIIKHHKKQLGNKWNPRHYWTYPSIIALTACDTSKYREKCFKLGMLGFLAKPVKILDLNMMIQTIIQWRCH